MAYYSSTKGSSVSNPPRLLVGTLAGSRGSSLMSTAKAGQHQQGGNLWYYGSTNPVGTVTGANFFTDGKKLGMQPGDVVMIAYFTTAGSSVVASMRCVEKVSTAGATLSTGYK